MAKARSRFLDFINQKQVREYSPVNIIGVGGIGSPVSVTLAAMGFNLVLWDPDQVNPENIGSQKYGFPDVGSFKVNIMKARLEKDFEVSVEARPEKYHGQEPLAGIVISGVDSLEERAKIWPAIKFNPAISLYLDGRVGGRRFKLFILNPCDLEKIDRYESHLDLNLPRPLMPCTSRFAPQAGSALDWCIISAIETFIGGEDVPFELVGTNFAIRALFI